METEEIHSFGDPFGNEVDDYADDSISAPTGESLPDSTPVAEGPVVVVQDAPEADPNSPAWVLPPNGPDMYDHFNGGVKHDQ